jgi:hypothetical protein
MCLHMEREQKIHLLLFPDNLSSSMYSSYERSDPVSLHRTTPHPSVYQGLLSSRTEATNIHLQLHVTTMKRNSHQVQLSLTLDSGGYKRREQQGRGGKCGSIKKLVVGTFALVLGGRDPKLYYTLLGHAHDSWSTWCGYIACFNDII